MKKLAQQNIALVKMSHKVLKNEKHIENLIEGVQIKTQIVY
jgi:hypothetical protein